jgi:hypothetical protein
MAMQAPGEYRHEAQRARLNAKEAPTTSLRITFLELAAVYESLANQLEDLEEHRQPLGNFKLRHWLSHTFGLQSDQKRSNKREH